jgi:hypothetical protein
LHNSEIYEIIKTYRFGYAVAIVEIGFDCLRRYLQGPPGRRACTDFGRVWSTAASSSTAQPSGTKRLNFCPYCAIIANNKVEKVRAINIYHVISKRCKMSTQSLPAPSLRTGHSLPAVRWVRRVRQVVNYLIYQALWLIMPAISVAEPSFLPALREEPGASALNSGETGAPPIARRLSVGDLVFSGLRALGRPGSAPSWLCSRCSMAFSEQSSASASRRWRLDAIDQARTLMDGFLGDRVASKVRSRRRCTGSPQSHLLSHGFRAVR